MSPVAKQMTSNMVFAMHNVMQICFVGFSTAVAESVAFNVYSLPGCSASSDDKFAILNQRNCKFFFGPNEAKYFLHSCHASTREFPGGH